MKFSPLKLTSSAPCQLQCLRKDQETANLNCPFKMSDTEDFPKLNEDETSSNDSENEDIDETDSENSDNSNENDISASALLSALRDAGKKTNQIEACQQQKTRQGSVLCHHPIGGEFMPRIPCCSRVMSC